MFSGEILHFHKVVPFSAVPDRQILYSVVAARHKGLWVCVRLRGRSDWCFPGGRREKGETVEENARRELFEETGALEYSLNPLGLYGVDHRAPPPPGQLPPAQSLPPGGRHLRYSWGGFFIADISRFGPIPEEFEIQERRLFARFPLQNARFPFIMPGMMNYLENKIQPSELD